MSPEATYVVESLATVTVFAGALWLATWGLRRVGATREGGPLEILARRSLDARRSIWLVRVGKRVLVVGASEGGLTRLGSTSLENVAAELAEEPPKGGGFGGVLRALRRGTEGRGRGAPSAPPPKGEGAEDHASRSTQSSR